MKLKIESEKPLAEREARQCVSQAILDFIGELGSSTAPPQVKLFNEKQQTLLVKVANEEVDKVISALALKTSFNTQRIALRLERISGTIKGLSYSG